MSMLVSAAAAILSIPVLLTAGTHGVGPGHHPRTAAARCGAVSAKYVPSCGSWFGTTGTPDLATAEGIAGRTADLYHDYKDFSSYAGARRFPGRSAQAAIDTHHMYFFDWKPQLVDGTILPWSSVASGARDADYVDVLARKIRSWSAAHHHEKVFMAFHAEPEDEVGTYGTAADYAQAWRHIDKRFRANHARKAVIFVWDMTGYMTRVPHWNALYPGDHVVDWLAWDPYGKTPSNPATAPVVPFSSAFGEARGSRPDHTGSTRFYKWADGAGALAPGTNKVYVKPGSRRKPLMVAEFSVCWATSTLGQAERWYARAARMIGRGQYPLVKAFVYFDAEPCEKPTGSQAMTASFRRAVSVRRLKQSRPY
jgi:hypothetical protein